MSITVISAVVPFIWTMISPKPFDSSKLNKIKDMYLGPLSAFVSAIGVIVCFFSELPDIETSRNACDRAI